MAGLAAISAYGNRAGEMQEADSDSDDGLDDVSAEAARRLKLRLQLRSWEAQFVRAEGRAATYEDKKLDRSYQELRSHLRHSELAWAALKREQQQALDWEGDSLSSRSARSGGGMSSRRTNSARNSKRMSLAEREKMEGRLKAMRDTASFSQRTGRRSTSRSFADTRRSDATTAYSMRQPGKGGSRPAGVIKAERMACGGGADRRSVYASVAARAALVDQLQPRRARVQPGGDDSSVGREGSHKGGALRRLQAQQAAAQQPPGAASQPPSVLALAQAQHPLQQDSSSKKPGGAGGGATGSVLAAAGVAVSVADDAAPSVEAPPKKKRARFADDAEEAGWRYKDGTRVEAPVQQHSQLLQALQQQARQSEMATLKALPDGIADALAKVHIALRGFAPQDEEKAAKLLRGFLTEGAEEGELRFPAVLHTALVAEYVQRFGQPPATGEDLHALAKKLLNERDARLQQSRVKSSLARFSKGSEAEASTVRGGAAAEGAASKGSMKKGSMKADGRQEAKDAKAKADEFTYFTAETVDRDPSTLLHARDRRKQPAAEAGGAEGGAETGHGPELRLVGCLVDCPNLLLALVLGTAFTLALTAGLIWASGDPSAQLSEPAQFRLSDSLTQNEHAAELAEKFALEHGELSRRATLAMRERQAELWHSLHLLYEAPRSEPTSLDLLRVDALARIRQIEQEIVNLPGFETFCYRPDGADAPCESPLSITTLVHNAASPSEVDTAAFNLTRGTDLVDAAATCAPSFSK